MKTFASMDPLGKLLTKSTMERFISQQVQLLNLLDQARKIDPGQFLKDRRGHFFGKLGTAF